MKITFTVVERFGTINQLLPVQGAYDELIISRDITEKIDFSQDEMKELEMRSETVQTEKGPGSRMVWNPEKAEKHTKEFDFTELEFNFIKTRLTQKSEAKELYRDFINLYGQFNKDFEKEHNPAKK